MPRERTRPIFTPRTPPPQGQPPSREIFPAMGEAGVFALLEEFYRALGETEIRDLFPEDLVAASQKSAAFFVQMLGGPPLYSQRYGPPRMRQRHLPFEIDAAARDVWRRTFDAVLETAPERHGFPAEHLPGFRVFLDEFSAWMVNAE